MQQIAKLCVRIISGVAYYIYRTYILLIYNGIHYVHIPLSSFLLFLILFVIFYTFCQLFTRFVKNHENTQFSPAGNSQKLRKHQVQRCNEPFYKSVHRWQNQTFLGRFPRRYGPRLEIKQNPAPISFCLFYVTHIKQTERDGGSAWVLLIIYIYIYIYSIQSAFYTRVDICINI